VSVGALLSSVLSGDDDRLLAGVAAREDNDNLASLETVGVKRGRNR
jgi:hypothetical protein